MSELTYNAINADTFEPELKLSLVPGIVIDCNTQINSYLVQPNNQQASLNAVPISIPNTTEGSASVLPVYRKGDYVLLMYLEESYTQQVASAFIVARIPNTDQYIDLPRYDKIKKLPQDNSSNKAEKQLMSSAQEYSVAYLNKSWGEERQGGDWGVGSSQVLLRVSEYVARMLAGSAGVSVNAIDSSVTTHGNVENKFLATNTQIGTIIGDTALVEEAVPLKPILFSDEDLKKVGNNFPEKELASTRKLTGAIPYGSVQYTLKERVENNKIKRTVYAEERDQRDGVKMFSSLRGFEFIKDSHQEGHLPLYTQSLVVDKKLKKLSDIKNPRVPFDRVDLDSNLWEEMLGLDRNLDNTFVRTPGDFDKADGELEDPDGSEVKMPYFKGRASIAYLDNGGIVIRDAWGSEIRMENGDIQISAARHLTYVSGADTVGIVGGVSSLTAKKEIDIGTDEGKLNLTANYYNAVFRTADIKHSINTKISLGDVEGEALAVNLVAEKAGLQLSNAGQLLCNGNLQLLARGRAILSGKGSAVDCNGVVHVAGSGIVLHGAVTISSEAFDAGSIENITIKTTGSAAYLQIEGNLRTKGVSVDGSVIAVGNISGNQLQALNPQRLAQGGYGVYKLNTLSVQSITPTQYPQVAVVDLYTDYKGLAPLSNTFLSSMFDSSGDTNYVVTPKFNNRAVNVAAFDQIPNVEVEGKTRYIYPGEKFWKKAGLVTVTNRKDAAFIRLETREGTPSIGVDKLCLNK